jgi:hypothetical protein
MPGREDDELRRMAAVLDRLFFSRCIDGLKSMPLMTRLLLASPHHQDTHGRPFGPLQEKTSMDRYLVYWKRFFCYCLNVLQLDEAALLEKHGFSFTGVQRRSLEGSWGRGFNILPRLGIAPRPAVSSTQLRLDTEQLLELTSKSPLNYPSRRNSSFRI